jgi:hypothetical protein
VATSNVSLDASNVSPEASIGSPEATTEGWGAAIAWIGRAIGASETFWNGLG